jgi:phosphoribosylglycinamide formyltransferase 2
MSETAFKKACDIAGKVTEALTGAGLWGVEFFISGDEVYFSELSPRPHDTGMVTLSGTQTFSEFELHCRAILGLPIPSITLQRAGVSAVILHMNDQQYKPSYTGLNTALEFENSDIRIFGKPITRKYRRMGVALTWDAKDADIKSLRAKAKQIADCISIHPLP